MKIITIHSPHDHVATLLAEEGVEERVREICAHGDFNIEIVEAITVEDLSDLLALDGPLEEFPACPTCGDPIDYCQGHGSVV